MKLLRHVVRERETSLEKIGFDDYESYLASRLYAGIRKRIFGRANGICEACCERKAVNIHHWSYSVATLLGKKPEHLEAVCRECHEKFHMDVPSPKHVVKRLFRQLVQSGGAIAQARDLTPRLISKRVEGIYG